MHQFQNERTILRLNSRQILACFDYNFSNADLLAVLQRIAQERISFVAALLWLEIVRLVEKHRIDLFLIDEILDVHGLSGFKINALEIFILEHDIFPLLVLVALHDLVPRNFLAVLFSDTLVAHGAQVAFAQKTKAELLSPGGRVQRDWYVDQAEADTAFPNCTCHIGLFRGAAL